MLKIRRPLGRLIFNMGIAIPGKTVFLIETAPWLFSNVVQCCALRNLHHCPTHSQYLLVCGSIIYDSVPRKVKILNKIWIPTTWYCHWRRSHLTFYLACCNMVIKNSSKLSICTLARHASPRRIPRLLFFALEHRLWADFLHTKLLLHAITISHNSPAQM